MNTCTSFIAGTALYKSSSVLQFSSADANYLLSDRHVKLVLGQVLDLAGFEAGNLPPHAHHARVSADIGDVSSAVSVQLSPDGPEIQSLLRLHFFQIDLQ